MQARTAKQRNKQRSNRERGQPPLDPKAAWWIVSKTSGIHHLIKANKQTFREHLPVTELYVRQLLK
jgi:hypothetical protein